jgi:hypothetical protein
MYVGDVTGITSSNPGNGNGQATSTTTRAQAQVLPLDNPPCIPVCEMTMKELLSLHQEYEEYKQNTPLTPLSLCPVCNYKVGQHKYLRLLDTVARTVRGNDNNHALTMGQQALSSRTVREHTPSRNLNLDILPQSSQENDAQVDVNSVHSHLDHDLEQVHASSSVRSHPISRDYSRQFDKVLGRISLWSKHNTHASSCREFLESLEYSLEIFSVPQDQWYRILPLVFEKGDYASARYVKSHITGPHPVSLDWSDAKSLFVSHFQRADYLQVVERDFGSCRQRPREPVQQYADRFLSFCEDLTIEDTSTQAISKFTNGLLDTIRKKYNNLVAMMELSPHGATFVQSLSAVVKACVKLDVAEGPYSEYVSSTNSKSSPKLYCKYHPNSTTHSTQDCRVRPSQPSRSTFMTKSTTTSSSAQGRPSTNLKCFSCGEVGHLSPSCPKRPLRPSGSSTTSSYSTSSSGTTRPPNSVRTIRHTKSTMDTKDSISSTDSLQTSTSSVASDSSTIIVSEPPTHDRRVSTASTSSSSMTPTPSSGQLIFSFNGIPTRVLPDTGADITLMDPVTASRLGLPIVPTEGTLQLAHRDSSIPRIGATTPTTLTALFLPSAHGDMRPSVTVTHAFELMPLAGNGYDIILGTDLMPTIFGNNIPLEYVGCHQVPVNDHPGALSSLTSDITSDDMKSPITEKTQGKNVVCKVFSFPNPRTVRDKNSTLTMGQSDLPPRTVRETITQKLPKTKNFHGELTDNGPLRDSAEPSIDMPHESFDTCSNDVNVTSAHSFDTLDTLDSTPEIYTTPELEKDYATKRELLYSDPEITQALQVNEAITGFCNIPESTLLFEVDPAMEDKLFRKQYPCAQAFEPIMTSKVMSWLASGRICHAPPGCKYNNPLHGVPKKDDQGNMTDVRPVLDTRILNSAIRSKDVFALPHIRQSLERFSGMSIFGEFDLSDAYLQFKLHPDVQPYTAFTWKGIQYMFVGCPFGLAILPSHFQRMMSSIFQDVGFTFPYLDNLPFASASWDDQRTRALTIIYRLNQVNLRIKPSSVKFGHSHMKCLGHLLCSSGVGIDPKKLDAIKSWPKPETGDELYTFLGFCTFLRDHIRHFADLTGPLEAVKNQKQLVWSDTLNKCFDTTKDALLRAPFLQYPDFSKPFHIAVDASNTGVGGVLYQPKSVDEHVSAHNIVSICSKKLNVSQRNYSPYKKELWGLVYCLRKFRHYVWGRNDLKVVTDHKPLSFLLSSPNIANAVQLWLDVILDFHFKVEHRPGILNVLPDSLSRMYASTYKETWGIPTNRITLPSLMGERSAVQHDPADIKGLTSSINVKSLTCPPTNGTSHDAPRTVRETSVETIEKNSFQHDFVTNGSREKNVKYFTAPLLPTNTYSIRSAHAASDSLLVEMEKRGVTIPSADDRPSLINSHHSLGHFGREAVFRALWNKKIWWPGIRDDISHTLDDCIPCARFTVVKSGYDPAQYIHAAGPWEHLQVDNCVHLPPSPDGHTTLLVVVDVFTGFTLLRALKSTASDEVARHLWDIFSVFGFPKILQSDNGPEFVSDLLRMFVKLTGVDHRFISPYNPRADGKVERTIGTVSMVIKKLLHGTDHHWPLFVPFTQYSYNLKVSSLTGSSPFSLIFGRKPNDLQDYTSSPPVNINLDDWKAHQDKMLSVILPAVNDRILLAKDKMVSHLNKTRRLLLSNSVPTGTTVMLKDPNENRPKFEPKYLGPYTIARRARNGAYVLKDLTGDLLDRHVPVDQLKILTKPKSSNASSGLQVDPSSVQVPDSLNQVYEVDHIVDHRGDPGHFEYLVRWKNYSSGDDSWEPQGNFHDDEVIRSYWRLKGLQRPKRRQPLNK